MSAPPKFAKLADAIAAYREGRSRRWAEVDGHQVDLHAAANPCAVSRPGVVTWEETTTFGDIDYFFMTGGTVEGWNEAVAANIAAELSQAVEVLPELAVPSEAARDVECCRECGRPMIGEVRATVVVLGDGFGAESSRTRERKAVKP